MTVTGWAVAADHPGLLEQRLDTTSITLTAPGPSSRLLAVHGVPDLDVVRAPAGNAFGAWALVPRARGRAGDGLVVVAVSLSGVDPGPAPEVVLDGARVRVTWADGTRSQADVDGPVPQVEPGW